MADLKEIANELATENGGDVILINASMDRGNETKFIEKCANLCRRENAIVIIVTNGGDADVAYRIARCLQQHYKRITAIISGQCKSAGTLLAIGAHELAFSDHGELGPLDVQLRKADDMWAATSGLTVMNAFAALQTKSEEAFTDFALSIKVRSGGSVTFKTAADIATKLTVGLFSHIYQQVEVMHVGEAARAMKIAEEYGQRLDQVADNLKDGASLGTLVAGYPSHGFVIDMKEARGLFKNVRTLTSRERELCDGLGHLARQQSARNEPVYYMSDPPTAPVEAKEHDAQQIGQGSTAGQEQRAAGAVEQAAPASQAGETTAEVVRLPTGTERA
ncbi:MAG: SppA protein [Blastocatellia bacterium]|nr:SppA protein [Blastocatellia bacterium]